MAKSRGVHYIGGQPLEYEYSTFIGAGLYWGSAPPRHKYKGLDTALCNGVHPGALVLVLIILFIIFSIVCELLDKRGLTVCSH